MISLLQAEWQKGIKHTVLTAFTVWLFPIGFGAILIMVLGFFAYDSRNMDSFSSGNLVTDMAGIFTIVSTFPGSFFGRLLPAAYLAMGFASEYQWNTWKNIVPINKRGALLIAKLISRTGIVMFGFLVTAGVVGGIQIAIHQIHDIPYVSDLTGEAVLVMIGQFSQFFLVAVLSTLFIGAVAALLTVITRSVFGALLATMMISNIEPLIPFVLASLSKFFDNFDLIKLNQVFPNYNLENLAFRFSSGASLAGDVPGIYDVFEISTSIGILLVWIVGLMALAIWNFNKQDLT